MNAINTDYSRLNKVKDFLEKKDINPLDPRNDLPVGLVHEKSVPMRGSIHASEKRTMSKKMMNFLFLFPSFFRR